MRSEEILERLFMSSASEAGEISRKKHPDYVIDLRAEAETPLSETVSVYGTKSFSLINGSPTDPEELLRAVRFTADLLERGGSAVLH
jgi:hypothetical protein